MIYPKVKIKDKQTGAITEVKKSLADDFIGTGKFVLYEEAEEEKRNEKSKDFILNK